MLASLILLAFDPNAAETARLRDVFVSACTRSQFLAGTVEPVETAAVSPALLRDTAGATIIKTFKISGLDGARLVIANFAGRADGVTTQCGVSAPQWSRAEAAKAVFTALAKPQPPVFGHTDSRLFWKPVGGNQDGNAYKVQLTYGSIKRTGFIVMRSYDDSGAGRRSNAAEMLSRCLSEKSGKFGRCDAGTIKNNRMILLGSYVSP